MPELYEFGIAGRIGPLIRSCLPTLTPDAEIDAPTLLTGTARCPEDLHRILDLLDNHGLPAQDIRLRYREEDSAGDGPPSRVMAMPSPNCEGHADT